MTTCLATVAVLVTGFFVTAGVAAGVAGALLTAAAAIAFLAGAVVWPGGVVGPSAHAIVPTAKAAAKVKEFMVVQQCIRKLRQKTDCPEVNSV